jgi:hypothetical protein
VVDADGSTRTLAEAGVDTEVGEHKVEHESRGIDRRALIKRAAAAGAVAWTAPVVVNSLTSPAAAITPGQSVTLFLHGLATTLPGTMDTTGPGATTRTKTIAKDGGAINTQTDTTKFHTWQATAAAPAGGEAVLGGAQLRIWTSSSGPHVVTAGLFSCPTSTTTANSNACTLLATGTASAASGTVAERTVTFGAFTVTAGGWLRVKIVNQDPPSGNDYIAMWDSGTRNSRLILTG